MDIQLYRPIVFIYRFPHALNITRLVLDRETVVGIFDGSITMWNDPKIVALNSQYAQILPSQRIRRVVRAETSGTTDILTHALHSFSQTWTEVTPTPKWPKADDGYIQTAEGSQGISKLVFLNEYSISYTSLRNAKENLHDYALMKNKAGTILEPTIAAAVSAMDDFKSQFDAKFFAQIVDAPGVNSWPVVGFNYYVYRETNMTDCAKANALQKYFKWVFETSTFESQTTASELIQQNYFAPNNKAVNNLVLKKIYEMNCNGKTLDLGLKPVKTGGIAFGFFVLLCVVVIIVAGIVWFIKFKLQELIESRISK
jgi:ABC-type phosphate transport system substrate-binding protein